MADSLYLENASKASITLAQEFEKNFTAYTERKKSEKTEEFSSEISLEDTQKITRYNPRRVRHRALGILGNRSCCFFQPANSFSFSGDLFPVQSAARLGTTEQETQLSCANFHRIESFYYHSKISTTEGEEDLLERKQLYKRCIAPFMHQLGDLRKQFQEKLKNIALTNVFQASKILTTPTLVCLLNTSDMSEILLHHLEQADTSSAEKQQLLLSVINCHAERLNTFLFDLLKKASTYIDLNDQALSEAIVHQYLTLIYYFSSPERNFMLPPAYRQCVTTLTDHFSSLTMNFEAIRLTALKHHHLIQQPLYQVIRMLATVDPSSIKVKSLLSDPVSTSEKETPETIFDRWLSIYQRNLREKKWELRSLLIRSFRSYGAAGGGIGGPMSLSYPYNVKYSSVSGFTVDVAGSTAQQLCNLLNGLMADLPKTISNGTSETEMTTLIAYPVAKATQLLKEIASLRKKEVRNPNIDEFYPRFIQSIELDKNRTIFYLFALQSFALFEKATQDIKDLLTPAEASNITFSHSIREIENVAALNGLINSHVENLQKETLPIFEKVAYRVLLIKNLLLNESLCFKYFSDPQYATSRDQLLDTLFSSEEKTTILEAAAQNQTHLIDALQKYLFPNIVNLEEPKPEPPRPLLHKIRCAIM